jgi:hypothetical protein
MKIRIRRDPRREREQRRPMTLVASAPAATPEPEIIRFRRRGLRVTSPIVDEPAAPKPEGARARVVAAIATIIAERGAGR